jgi:hypothetical protein
MNQLHLIVIHEVIILFTWFQHNLHQGGHVLS